LETKLIETPLIQQKKQTKLRTSNLKTIKTKNPHQEKQYNTAENKNNQKP